MEQVKVYADGEVEIVNSTEEVSGAQLRAIIERIERLEEEKKTVGEDIKEVYAEAKGNGFDPKIIRQIVKIRSSDPEDRIEQETLLEIYMAALGSH